ncbi:hypothetical protein [Paraburkholderia hospita]|uniref:hypothetical protein n=1 Tax=Paraburkholderia hospita TaxID=169430 RepID=UPI0010549DFE|nr:hypothetical protein [Paraburkholderia hospita]
MTLLAFYLFVSRPDTTGQEIVSFKHELDTCLRSASGEQLREADCFALCKETKMKTEVKRGDVGAVRGATSYFAGDAGNVVHLRDAGLIDAAVNVARKTRLPIRDIQDVMKIGEEISLSMRELEGRLDDSGVDQRYVPRFLNEYVYPMLGHEHEVSGGNAKLYRRCYERFGSNPDAISHIRLGEMILLLSADDELVARVVDARKANPRLRRDDVQRLIREYRVVRASEGIS